ncbi:hypothetical protein, partial [Bacillus cereus]|uniref:hypothetical protein n=3 Tax=Bacillus cereus TaxID=1396 RepID=UPI001C54DE43
ISIKIQLIIKINKILLFSDKTFLYFEDYSKYYLDSNITILLRNLKNSNQYILAVKKSIQSKINGDLST